MKAIELAKHLLEHPNMDVYLKHCGEEVPVEIVILKPKSKHLTLETC